MDQFADFYHREQHALVRFAATVVGPDRADDVVANAMVSVMKRFLTDTSARRVPVDGDGLRPYVYRAVANAGAKDWRTISRRERREALADRLTPRAAEPSGFTAGAAAGTGAADDTAIATALSRLSPRQRAVIHLCYWEDLTPPDIADRLQISEGSVRRHLARARSNLRAALSTSQLPSDLDHQSLMGGAR